ncbi:MAG: lysophospholipase [Caldilineales bacterium]|nr:lysophospholipase [Caldilineales bacterium]
MAYQETILTAHDGLNLFLRTWTPDSAPRAILVIVHGLGEHAGRYQHVVRLFNERGYVIYGHDHRGFGKSGGKRGDFEDFDDVLRDLDQIVDLARQTYPGLPLGFFAHSLGGMIGTHYLAGYGHNKVNAAIISSPGYGVGPDYSPFKLTMARVLGRVAPGLSIQSGSHDDYTLSHDPDSKAAYFADDIYHHTVTIRFVNACLAKAEEAGDLLSTLRMPALVLMGELDTTINRQAILAATGRCDNDVSFRQYPDCLHEMHNELPELRDPILQDAAEWLNQNLGLA